MFSQEYDDDLAGTDFSATLFKAAHLDQSRLQYFYVGFDERHTGVTVGCTQREGNKVWAVVDVRPDSEVGVCRSGNFAEYSIISSL